MTQRSRTAAAEINTLLDKSSTPSPFDRPRSESHTPHDKSPASRVFVPSRFRGGSTSVDSSKIARAPASFRPGMGRGGGFSARGARGSARAGMSGPGRERFGAEQFRGRGRGRGRGLDRGGRGGRRRGRGGGRGREDGEGPGVDQRDEAVIKAEMAEMSKADLGIETVYNPMTSLESLIGHGPAIAADSNPFADTETLMANMKVLSRVTNPSGTPGVVKQLLTEEKTMFFPNLEVKAQMEVGLGGEQMSGPDSVVKSTILAKALGGEYEEPKATSISDPLSMARNYHLKESTYLKKDMQRFEAKLESLLPKSQKTSSQPKT